MSERIICNDNGGELREEIVRCRDCMHIEPRTFNDPIVTDITVDWFSCDYFNRPTRRDGFCAWGRRSGL